jgi:hypothetical protein
LRPTPNLEDQIPVFMSPSDRVTQLYPQAPGSLSVAFYDSQGYGGGIPTRLGRAVAQALASHRGGPGSRPGSVWSLWSTKRHWGSFLRVLRFPLPIIPPISPSS